jgi:DNA polymerase III epsilon subunit-like protein
MNEWILVDTETDGLMSPIFAVEVAAQRFKGFIPDGDPFRIFIDHGIEIPPAATAVHGYTTDFIKKNGVNPQKAYEQLGGYINGAPIASHYLGFDWNRVLYPEWDRLGIKPLGTRGFCTWRLAKRSLPEYPTHKLDFLRDELGLKCSKAHSALGDIESVEDLLTRIIFPKLLEKGIKTIDGVVEFSLLHPLRCRCLIQDLKYEIELERVESERARQKEEKIANRKEEEARQRFIMDVQTGSYPLPKLINDFDLIEEEPVVCFKDRVFLFTGKMKWGSRSKAGLAVEKMGGKVSMAKQLSLETDYLVLGEDPEDGWTRRVSKLTQAFLRKLKGTNPSFRIILEKDFVDALDSEPIDPPKGEVTAKQRLAEEKRIKEEDYAKRRAQYSINFDDPPTRS